MPNYWLYREDSEVDLMTTETPWKAKKVIYAVVATFMGYFGIGLSSQASFQQDKPTIRLGIALLGIAFASLNCYLNARWQTRHQADSFRNAGALHTALTWTGNVTIYFLTGVAISWLENSKDGVVSMAFCLAVSGVFATCLYLLYRHEFRARASSATPYPC